VLHDLVPLGEDEVERAEKLRLPLFESPLMLAFRLPCPRLDDRADARTCAVYAERPRTCASYACAVLEAYGAGEIDEVTARERIDRVRALAKETDADARRQLSWMRKTWFDPGTPSAPSSGVKSGEFK
jgi:Fe-S-cluster containining protein